MHKDEEIKSWVDEHIDQLVAKHCLPGEKEFQAEIGIRGKDGKEHRYTVFMEYTELKTGNGWTVRNIVRPEQLQ